jgi:hypothetical protein
MLLYRPGLLISLMAVAEVWDAAATNFTGATLSAFICEYPIYLVCK